MKILFSYNSLVECLSKLNEVTKNIKIEKMKSPKEGFMQSIIVQFEEKILNLNISKNKLEAYANIDYVNEITYNIKKQQNNIYEIHEIENECKPFTKDEITNELLSKGIRLGIISDEVEKLIKNPQQKILIAKGIPAVHDKQDKLISNIKKRERNVDEESVENIDYRNLYSIQTTTVGSVIGELIIGDVGKNGIDLMGNIIPKKNKKRVALVAGEGCEIVENKIIATRDGRPSMRGQTFTVYSVYNVNEDVDISLGNIKFNGDIEISKSVKIGMLVEGKNITVGGNVEESTINASGELRVRGNIIKSNFNVGSVDIEKSKCIEMLIEYKAKLENLIDSVKQLKDYNTFVAQKSDGELLKILLESKFKEIIKYEVQIARYTVTKVISTKEILQTIRRKISGTGPENIKFVNQIYKLTDLIAVEIEKLKNDENIKSDMYFNYCQDSVINVSGDIIIEGKGQYVSNIKSLGKIIFKDKKAVCRGGSIEAEEFIAAKEVGTLSGATTNLKVGKNGVITAEVVYQNTVFTIGERIYNFDSNYRQVKGYIDKEGELQIEKFIL